MAGQAATTRSVRREPQWPLKTSRVLLSDEQIRRARQLCRTDTAATKIKDAIVQHAAYWAEKTDKQLRELLPGGEVPRAFNVSTEGCPVHGKQVYQFGTYPWKLDRDRPFVVICPVGGETYPSNDFAAYYHTGMKDRSLLVGKYVDDGWGWLSPEGKRSWLVGYACHWAWRKYWLPAVDQLARAYVLTGDRKYARKAAVMLDRIAEVYPDMNYAHQSRYGQLMNGRYQGKILNAIWETGVLERLAIAYDSIFDALVGTDPIKLTDRTSQDVRANIEANLLEEGIKAIQSGRIRGNFGMHQSALAHAVIVRQNGPTKALLEQILSGSGRGWSDEGVDYALYNLVYKDGMPFETSPGYCAIWLDRFVSLADVLAHADIDLYGRAKLRRMFRAFSELVCARQFTPAIGDAGSIEAGWIGPGAATYLAGFRAYHDPSLAWAAKQLEGLKPEQVSDYADLFGPSRAAGALKAADDYEHRPSSRFLDGYGIVIMNNPADATAVSMYYGQRGGHGHFDQLNLELFAHGHRVSPDLGYPDFMNAFVPGIYTWSKNTISHNTVAVDRQRQTGNPHGKLLRFHDSRIAHVSDVEAAATYPQTHTYRRTLLLVDVSPAESYLVDVFRVAGGNVNDLSLHGPEGRFKMIEGRLSNPQIKGTLAGENVEYGHLYDDPVRGKPGYQGGFGGYQGSGYQHLFNVQRLRDGEACTAEWQLKGTDDARLRVRILPQDQQQIIVADAYVSPTRKRPTILKYVIAQRAGDDLESCYVTVWEPFRGAPIIRGAELIEVTPTEPGALRSVALHVRRHGEDDWILLAPAPGVMRKVGRIMRTDAGVALIRTASGERVSSFACGGTKLISPRHGLEVAIPRTLAGEVVRVDYRERKIGLNVPGRQLNHRMLSGRTVRIFNGRHSCAYRVASATYGRDGLTLALAGSDVFTGRLRIEKVDSTTRTMSTPTCLMWPDYLTGMRLVTKDLQRQFLIESVSEGKVRLAAGAEIGDAFGTPGENGALNAWIADFGPGDRFEIEMASAT